MILTTEASTTSSWSTSGKEQYIFRMNKWKTLRYTKLSYWLVLHHRSPLASIYSTSTMENHHFNMAINILQQVSYSFTRIRLFHQNIKIWNKYLTLIYWFAGAPQHFLKAESRRIQAGVWPPSFRLEAFLIYKSILFTCIKSHHLLWSWHHSLFYLILYKVLWKINLQSGSGQHEALHPCHWSRSLLPK